MLVWRLVGSLQTKSRTETCENRKPGFKAQLQLLPRPLHKLKLSFECGLSVLDFVWRLQASTAGSWDLVIDVQQAMACIALTFHPETICFDLKSRSDQPRTPSRMQEARGSSNSQWQVTQTVRPQNEMVGYFNITASLDYDCVVVASSVHVCKVVISAWDQSVLSLPVSPRNESIPQSVLRFTVGRFSLYNFTRNSLSGYYQVSCRYVWHFDTQNLTFQTSNTNALQSQYRWFPNAN